MTNKERERRKEQSFKDNPQKHYAKCLKRGCCKNCLKNIEGERKVSGAGIFGSPFGGGGSYKTKQKYRKCAASNQEIVNEYNRCEMYESIEKKNKNVYNKEVINTIFGIR